MPNFSSLAFTQTDLGKFLTYFKKISEFFSKNLKQILKISKSEYACLCVYKLSTFMTNFSSLAFTQTDLGKFLTFFKKISEFFSKSLKQILKISKSEYACLCVYKQSTFMWNFSSLALTQTDLGNFFTFFQKKIRIFQQKSKANFENF